MAPLARMVHALPGRRRIRIDERRGDEKYFATVEKELASCPGILAVEANFLTASVLVHHEADDALIWRYAAEQELFHFKDDSAGMPAESRAVASSPEAAKRNPQAVSGGHINWRPLIFLGLAGLGIAQAIEGNIAVPAITAFWYALNALPQANASNVERRFLEAEPPGSL